MIFKNFNEFLEWYKQLNEAEEIDMHEAYQIYFHMSTYLNVGDF